MRQSPPFLVERENVVVVVIKFRILRVPIRVLPTASFVSVQWVASKDSASRGRID